MDRAAYLDTIAAESAAFQAAVASTRLATSVPACPDWTVADLVYHLGEVHYFWGQVAERRLSSPEAVETPARPADAELVDWARAQADHLHEVLAAADPHTPVWTWAAQK